MTNSQKFTAAHKLAKTYEGNYRACFALALKVLNGTLEIEMKNTTIIRKAFFTNDQTQFGIRFTYEGSEIVHTDHEEGVVLEF
jgi:hypothetical protein